MSDLGPINKDTSRSCVFDFPDRPVRPVPPIDPGTGEPPVDYPYDPKDDWPTPGLIDPDAPAPVPGQDPIPGSDPHPSTLPITMLQLYCQSLVGGGLYPDWSIHITSDDVLMDGWSATGVADSGFPSYAHFFGGVPPNEIEYGEFSWADGGSIFTSLVGAADGSANRSISGTIHMQLNAVPVKQPMRVGIRGIRYVYPIHEYILGGSGGAIPTKDAWHKLDSSDIQVAEHFIDIADVSSPGTLIRDFSWSFNHLTRHLTLVQL